MNNARSNELAAVLEGSLHLLDRARDGDWETLSLLQREHHQLIENFFVESVPDEDAAVVAAAIKRIVEINEQIASLGAIVRDNCLQEAGTHNHRRQAVKEYTENKLQHRGWK